MDPKHQVICQDIDPGLSSSTEHPSTHPSRLHWVRQVLHRPPCLNHGPRLQLTELYINITKPGGWTRCFLLMTSGLVLIVNELCGYTEVVSRNLADGVFNLYCLNWWGKGWHMVAYPFRSLVVVFRMFTSIMCLIWLVSGYCVYIYPPTLDVSIDGHYFWTTDWIIQNGPPFYQIYMLKLV